MRVIMPAEGLNFDGIVYPGDVEINVRSAAQARAFAERGATVIFDSDGIVYPEGVMAPARVPAPAADADQPPVDPSAVELIDPETTEGQTSQTPAGTEAPNDKPKRGGSRTGASKPR